MLITMKYFDTLSQNNEPIFYKNAFSFEIIQI